MSKLTEFIEDIFIERRWGDYGGVQEPTFVELVTLQELVTSLTEKD